MTTRFHRTYALLAALPLLAACGSDTVSVEPTRPTAAVHAACARLVARLPARVADGSRRRVSDDALGAAWGNPAVVLRCGVGRPAGLTVFSTCQRANGIDWFVPESAIEDPSADVVMTTIGRSPSVEVRVPAELRPPVAAMVDLAPALHALTRRQGRGCV